MWWSDCLWGTQCVSYLRRTETMAVAMMILEVGETAVAGRQTPVALLPEQTSTVE